MQSLRLNDTHLHYQVIGADEAKPSIVFVNALGTDGRIWRDVVVRLVGEAGIVTYDKRGHGLSGLGEPPATIADHAADLAALLDHLGGRPCVVCGLSVGGLVAQEIALARPDLVAGIVLVATGLAIGGRAMWDERLAEVESRGMERVADGAMERWFTDGFRADRPEEVALYRTMLARQPAAGYAGTVRAIRDADFADRAGAISLPALCIAGEHDRSTPPSLLRDLANAIPEARFEVVKGAAHLVPVEEPHALAQMIGAFLALVGAERGEGTGTA